MLDDARRVYLILGVSLLLFLVLSWGSHGRTSRWTRPPQAEARRAR